MFLFLISLNSCSSTLYWNCKAVAFLGHELCVFMEVSLGILLLLNIDFIRKYELSLIRLVNSI